MTLSNQAIQLALQNQWLEAIEINRQILLENSDDIDALNRLGQAFMQSGDVCSAKEVYERVLSLDHCNTIAKRNLQKIVSLDGKSPVQNNLTNKSLQFIEEPGKTRIVTLLNLADQGVLNILQSCCQLKFNIRPKTVSLYYEDKYVGKLPDDLSRRLIWLHKRSNRYEAYVKSVEKNKVSVFIKEVKQSLENKNIASFKNSEVGV